LESSRRLDADKGRLGDPTTDAAAEDAAELAERLARGQVRLFRVGVYLTVHAPTQDDLIQAVAEVRAAAASVLLDTQPATWRQLQGWTSTLPLGHAGLGMPRLAAAIGGTILRLGAPGVRLNPFDIPPADRRRDALVRRQLFLHTLISVLLSEPVSPAVLDKAVHATYDAAGINNDPATWTRPAPLLRDLAATLAKSVDPAARILADRLSPWTQGSFKDLFDGPSTVTPT